MQLKQAKIGVSALADAVALNLLAHGAERVGFAADDLGSYVVAASIDDASLLLSAVGAVATRKGVRRRRDRHVLTTLVFWHLQQDGPQRLASFEQLLTALQSGGWTRPDVVAAVVRIASACEIADSRGHIAAAVEQCISDAIEETSDEPDYSAELLRLVRALSEWPDPAAQQLLWRLAATRDIEVEWPAAKALAMMNDGREAALHAVSERILQRAECERPLSLSGRADPLGNEVASLAWILPAIRDVNEAAERQLSRVAALCLDPDMSPLRGEMSLAQGLKFAIINERAVMRNVEHAHELLTRESGGPRFWHARLVLVQALLAHAWRHPDDADRWVAQFKSLGTREPHRLVSRGIALAQQGLRERKRAASGYSRLSAFMWTHERDAVRWVEQGKDEIAQLAADVVLLSNMTYRLRKSDAQRADGAAANSDLPGCIRNSWKRSNITRGCSCTHKLCEGPLDPAVVATRARFTESFCREQARLAVRLGMPQWVAWRIFSYWGKQHLEQFWVEQAKIAQAGWAQDLI